jgi:hypothetical protein
MSEPEDPTATVVRLLQKNIRVIKEDDSIASIQVSQEWCDRELFKNYDGQITVGLSESRDTKVEMNGRLRRRLCSFRVNVWATDKPTSSDSGKLMRQKMIEEVNRAIRQNRNIPFQTLYNFYGLGYPSGEPHKAFTCEAASDPLPSSSAWIEISSANYQKLWTSDDNRLLSGSTDYVPFMLFKFRVEPQEQCVKKVVLSFEGYGLAPGGNGLTIKVWNHTVGVWQQAQTSSGDQDETLFITISLNCQDFIDSSGYLFLLARTINSGLGELPGARLYCDFVQCTIQVYGVSHIDVESYRLIDVTEFKPFIFRAEFQLKGWLFESIQDLS